MSEEKRTEAPEHYAAPSGPGLEPWDYIKAHSLSFWEGNVIKYVTRAGRKAGASRLDDYRKAQNYLTFLIAEEESAGGPSAPERVRREEDWIYEKHYEEWGHRLGDPAKCLVCMKNIRAAGLA